MAEKPTIYLFGGGNGSGKTSFARAFLPNEIGGDIRFLNADEIARGLSPFSPESVAFKAGRLLLTEVEGCLDAGLSFGLESTLSGRTYVGMLSRAKRAGYEIELHYLWLGSADMAVRRVRQRVKKGGHSVPEADIRRRYSRSMTHLLEDYLPLADRWYLWQNRGREPILLADSDRNGIVNVAEIFRQP